MYTFLLFLEQYLEIFYFLTFIIGISIGSFLNVIIYRLPIIMHNNYRKECIEYLNLEHSKTDTKMLSGNLFKPAFSFCPNCEHYIKWYHNIPIISYLLLLGKCAYCKSAISGRYLIVEFITGTLFVIQAIFFGINLEFLYSIILTSSLIIISFIDLDYKIIPDEIIYPILWLGLLGNINDLFTSLQEAVAGAALGYMGIWIFVKLYELLSGKVAMGNGDFKLLALSGAWLGLQQLAIIIMISSLLGSVIGIFMIITKRLNKKSTIPFGPYIAIAIWTSLIWGDSMWIAYVKHLQLPNV